MPLLYCTLFKVHCWSQEELDGDLKGKIGPHVVTGLGPWWKATMNGEKNEWLRPHNIRGPHSWYCSASLLRGSRAQVGDFHRVRPLCEEGHLGSRGRGGRGYNEWTFLEHLYRPLPALVGNNRVYRGWGMLVGYYIPGNSPAPHPDHRAGGTTAHEEVAQSQFDPFPPGRWPGGAGNIFCQLKAVWRLLPPERCLGGANHVFLQHINVIPFLVNIFVPSPLRSLLWSICYPPFPIMDHNL